MGLNTYQQFHNNSVKFLLSTTVIIWNDLMRLCKTSVVFKDVDHRCYRASLSVAVAVVHSYTPSESQLHLSDDGGERYQWAALTGWKYEGLGHYQVSRSNAISHLSPPSLLQASSQEEPEPVPGGGEALPVRLGEQPHHLGGEVHGHRLPHQGLQQEVLFHPDIRYGCLSEGLISSYK